MTDSLTSFLAEHLTGHDQQDAAALAAALRERFDIREKTTERAPQATTVQRGQTWRNRKTDRLVKVTAAPGETVPHPETGQPVVTRQVRWEAITGRGPRTGRIYPHNWPANFDFVEENR